MDSGEGVPSQCLVARELFKRWLAEEPIHRTAFATPEAVKDYLKLHFAGREYESFVVLYLDAQNCLIEVEEPFRGKLTQTSVYPREVVKSALRFNRHIVVKVADRTAHKSAKGSARYFPVRNHTYPHP